MKKTRILSVLCLVLVGLMLVACGSGSSSTPASRSTAPPTSRPTQQSNTMKVTVVNNSDYIFNELYITPTASSDWGEDHLGSTSILKKNGSFEVTLDKYDFDNFDILVVDEDDFTYVFKYVTLFNGTEVYIGFDDGLGADVVHADGTDEFIAGELYGEGGNDNGGGQSSSSQGTGTGNDTFGAFEFTVYNESDYDIYAIYMGVSDAASEHDFDLLPSILAAHTSTEVSGVVSQGDWLNTEWTLNVQDVDGDWSLSFDVFNPWTVDYVDIYWDSASGGYVCEFFY